MKLNLSKTLGVEILPTPPMPPEHEPTNKYAYIREDGTQVMVKEDESTKTDNGEPVCVWEYWNVIADWTGAGDVRTYELLPIEVD